MSSRARRDDKCSKVSFFSSHSRTAVQLARTPKKAKPSAAEMGGVRGLPRLRQSNSLACRRRPSRAQRQGLAQRGFGVIPRLRHNTACQRAEESKVQRPGRAQRIRGVLGSPPTTAIKLARTPKKAKPSEAASPSAAEKGGGRGLLDFDTTQHALAQNKAKRSGEPERCGVGGFSSVSPDFDSATRPCVKEAKRSDHAKASGKRVPLDCKSNPRSAKLRTHPKRHLV
jgi:hypothetical protein